MRKPWNRVDLPVYSVSSKAGEEENMHICTYVSSVSIAPKRYMVALYHGTKTIELVTRNGHFLLQLLSSEQYPLVRTLGQRSGHRVNKLKELRKKDKIGAYAGFSYLKEALAVIECKVLESLEGGDHLLLLCDVVSFRNLNEGKVLTTGFLREKKIIRA